MEGEEEESNQDEESDNGDQVTETAQAQSEAGKQPIFHHEIYERLVRLMRRQGFYRTLHQKLHL